MGYGCGAGREANHVSAHGLDKVPWSNSLHPSPSGVIASSPIGHSNIDIRSLLSGAANL